MFSISLSSKLDLFILYESISKKKITFYSIIGWPQQSTPSTSPPLKWKVQCTKWMQSALVNEKKFSNSKTETKHWLRAPNVFAPREKALQKVKSSFLWWPSLRSHALSLSFILLLKVVIRFGPALRREKIDSTFQWRNVNVTLRNACRVGYVLIQSVL